MSFDVKLLKDSITAENKRLRTFQLRYPRFIHAELMTHRMFSRNASSSRAIPVQRMIQDILDDPATPIHWGANQPGMQARSELTAEDAHRGYLAWISARDDAVKHAEYLNTIGAHKQIVNRILEPFMHINVVLSSTDLANFYALRNHEDAQPEIRHLAQMMFMAQEVSVPKLLHPGDWHLPYITDDDITDIVDRCLKDRITRDMPDWDKEVLPILIKVSVARCARVSYKLHDGSNSSIEKDIELHDRLLDSVPLHASPAEHQATPDTKRYQYLPFEHVVQENPTITAVGFDREQIWEYPNEHGNLKGWRQYRKTLLKEYVPG